MPTLPMPTLEDALELALKVHRGTTDKGGTQPYILHPIRVMLRLESEAERIVALLHDVVEDSKYSFDDLRRLGYPDDIVAALECVTRRKAPVEESYEAFIERAATNPIARRVKLADLEDNMDVRRLAAVSAQDGERLAKYRRAWGRLRQER